MLNMCIILSRFFLELNGDHQLQGLLSGPLSLYQRSLDRLNYSFVSETGIGSEKDDGSFSGCLGLLLSNRSDFMIHPMIPLAPHDIVSVAAAGSWTPVVMSAYNSETSISPRRISLTNFLRSLDRPVWLIGLMILLMLLCLILAFIVIRYHVKAPTVIRLLTSIGITFCLKQAGSRMQVSRVHPPKALILLLMLLSSSIMFHMSAMIKTSAVVYQKPKVIDTFDQLISSGRRPTFMADVQMLERLRDSLPGSSSRRLYQHIMLLGEQESKIGKSFASFGQHVRRLMQQQEAMLMQDSLSDWLLGQVCALAVHQEGLTNASLWLTKPGAEAAEPIRGHVVRRSLEARVKQEIGGRLQRIFESSAFMQEQRLLRVKASHTITGSPEGNQRVQQCMSCQVSSPKPPDYGSVIMKQVHTLLTTIAVLILTDILMIIYEYLTAQQS